MRKKVFIVGICLVLVILLILTFIIQSQKDITVAENINTMEAAERIESEFGISLEANEHGGFDWRYIDAANEVRTNNTYYIDLDSDENGMLDFFEATISYGRLQEKEGFYDEAEDFLLSVIPTIFKNEDNVAYVENFVKKNLPDYDDDEIYDIHEEAIVSNYKVELWITKSGDYYSRYALNVIKNV